MITVGVFDIFNTPDSPAAGLIGHYYRSYRRYEGVEQVISGGVGVPTFHQGVGYQLFIRIGVGYQLFPPVGEATQN